MTIKGWFVPEIRVIPSKLFKQHYIPSGHNLVYWAIRGGAMKSLQRSDSSIDAHHLSGDPTFHPKVKNAARAATSSVLPTRCSGCRLAAFSRFSAVFNSVADRSDATNEGAIALKRICWRHIQRPAFHQAFHAAFADSNAAVKRHSQFGGYRTEKYHAGTVASPERRQALLYQADGAEHIQPKVAGNHRPASG